MRNSTSHDLAEKYRRESDMFRNPHSTFGQKEEKKRKKNYPPAPKLNHNRSVSRIKEEESRDGRGTSQGKRSRKSLNIKSLNKPKMGGIYGIPRRSPITYENKHEKISVNKRKIKPYFDPENMWTHIQSSKKQQSRELRKLSRDVKNNRINVQSREFQDKMSKFSEDDSDIRNDPLFLELEKLMEGKDNRSRDNFSVQEMKKHKSVGRIETLSQQHSSFIKRSR